MQDQKHAIGILNQLIEVSKDGEAGFRACSDDAKDPGLKSYFEECAARCRASAQGLGDEVTRLGGQAEDSGSVAGAVHRVFVNLKAVLATNDDLAVLEECERGEDVALRAYTQALDEPLPDSARALVQSQYLGVKHNHDRVKALRDDRRRRIA